MCVCNKEFAEFCFPFPILLHATFFLLFVAKKRNVNSLEKYLVCILNKKVD